MRICVPTLFVIASSLLISSACVKRGPDDSTSRSVIEFTDDPSAKGNLAIILNGRSDPGTPHLESASLITDGSGQRALLWSDTLLKLGFKVRLYDGTPILNVFENSRDEFEKLSPEAHVLFLLLGHGNADGSFCQFQENVTFDVWESGLLRVLKTGATYDRLTLLTNSCYGGAWVNRLRESENSDSAAPELRSRFRSVFGLATTRHDLVAFEVNSRNSLGETVPQGDLELFRQFLFSSAMSYRSLEGALRELENQVYGLAREAYQREGISREKFSLTHFAYPKSLYQSRFVSSDYPSDNEAKVENVPVRTFRVIWYPGGRKVENSGGSRGRVAECIAQLETNEKLSGRIETIYHNAVWGISTFQVSSSLTDPDFQSSSAELKRCGFVSEVKSPPVKGQQSSSRLTFRLMGVTAQQMKACLAAELAPAAEGFVDPLSGVEIDQQDSTTIVVFPERLLPVLRDGPCLSRERIELAY